MTEILPHSHHPDIRGASFSSINGNQINNHYNAPTSINQPPEVITYRLNGKMVYVTPATNYEVSPSQSQIHFCQFILTILQQALDFAQNLFPEELSTVKRDRISFSVLRVDISRSLNKSRHEAARIAPIAWQAVVGGLKTYEIIDIHVQVQPPPAEVLTYRFNNRMIYVNTASDYEVSQSQIQFCSLILTTTLASPRFRTECLSRKTPPLEARSNIVFHALRQSNTKYLHYPYSLEGRRGPS